MMTTMQHGRFGVFMGLLLAAAGLLVDAPGSVGLSAPASYAMTNPEQTRMYRELGPQLAAHPGESGFHLFPNGPDALVTRLALIDRAARTVDSQCFILEDDSVGNLLLDRVLAAARRGVKVRLLVDDWNLEGQDRRLAWLGAQPIRSPDI